MSRLVTRILVCATVLIPAVATAAVFDDGGGGGRLYNPLGDTNLWTLVGKVLDFVIEIGAVVIVFMMVYVGFLFVTAQSSETRLTAAKQALLWTIVGALILLGSKAISYGICETARSLSTGSTITCTLVP